MDFGSVYIVFKAKCLSLDEKSSALLGALLFQPVLHLICFGKLALWYDQMRGEFCVSLPCKHSFRVLSLTIYGHCRISKVFKNRCYLGPVGVTGDS